MSLADNINVNDKLKAINFDHLRGLLTPNELVQLKIIQEAIERCVVVDNGNMFVNHLCIHINKHEDKDIYFNGDSFVVNDKKKEV